MIVQKTQKICLNAFLTQLCVDDNEPAVLKLVAYFRNLMEQIISGTLRQLPHTSVITADFVKKKKKKYFFNVSDCVELWLIRSTADAQWLGPTLVSTRLHDIRNKVHELSCH